MKYKVEITETLSKTVEVEATSLDEAIERVEEQWNNSDIVLYPEDFSFVEFHEAEKEKTTKKNGIDFKGLETALKEFDENGIRAECGKWTVVRGGYDKQFEIHYEGYTVLNCVADMLSGEYRPNEQWNDQTEQKLKEIVANAYGLDLHKTITSIDELKEAIENYGWSVSEFSYSDGDAGWELSQYSPAGEDFSFSICHNNDIKKAIKEISDYAYNFDTEEHIEMWVEAKNSVDGVPSISDLVEDADAIQEMLDELTDFCSDLELEHENEYEYEME